MSVMTPRLASAQSRDCNIVASCAGCGLWVVGCGLWVVEGHGKINLADAVGTVVGGEELFGDA